MKKPINYRIFLFSEQTGQFAPTIHPTNKDSVALAQYARKTLKLEQNLSGKAPFEIHPENWSPRG